MTTEREKQHRQHEKSMEFTYFSCGIEFKFYAKTWKDLEQAAARVDSPLWCTAERLVGFGGERGHHGIPRFYGCINFSMNNAATLSLVYKTADHLADGLKCLACLGKSDMLLSLLVKNRDIQPVFGNGCVRQVLLQKFQERCLITLAQGSFVEKDMELIMACKPCALEPEGRDVVIEEAAFIYATKVGLAWEGPFSLSLERRYGPQHLRSSVLEQFAQNDNPCKTLSLFDFQLDKDDCQVLLNIENAEDLSLHHCRLYDGGDCFVRAIQSGAGPRNLAPWSGTFSWSKRIQITKALMSPRCAVEQYKMDMFDGIGPRSEETMAAICQCLETNKSLVSFTVGGALMNQEQLIDWSRHLNVIHR